MIEPKTQREKDSYLKGYKEAEKAYGGCHRCYGKGYSTVRYGYTGAPDFEGDQGFIEPVSTHVHFCECDRGKQLKELWPKKQ